MAGRIVDIGFRRASAERLLSVCWQLRASVRRRPHRPAWSAPTWTVRGSVPGRRLRSKLGRPAHQIDQAGVTFRVTPGSPNLQFTSNHMDDNVVRLPSSHHESNQKAPELLLRGFLVASPFACRCIGVRPNRRSQVGPARPRDTASGSHADYCVPAARLGRIIPRHRRASG